MAERTIEALRYFFNFLRTVSLRSTENRMDSSNLAVIFAPNLLHAHENEKMSASTEKKIRLQAAVVETLIEHAAEIGQVPEFILEKIPAMLGVDAFQSTPSLWGHEDSENESPSEYKKRRHRSVGVFSSVTPVVLTPSTKRKLPADCSQGLSSKKRRSFKHSFAFEFLPSSIFNSSSTPASVQFEASPCVSLESSQTSLSPSTGGEIHLSSTGNRRSKRHTSKKLYRAESGKTGCFSPKISRKEMVRRSLRLKFGLGKSSRETNIASGSVVGNRSENIGRRLASQQGLESRNECTKGDVLFSPCIGEKFPKKGSKNVSKSEENLLTPKYHDKVVHRMSWNSPTVTDSQAIGRNEGILPGHPERGIISSESGLIFGKLPVVPDEFKSTTVSKQDNSLEILLCEEENSSTAETLLKVKEAFTASGSNPVIGDKTSSFSDVASKTLNEALCLLGLSSEKGLTEEVSENLANTKARELLQESNQLHAVDKQQLKKDDLKILEKNFKTSIEIELQVPKPGIKNTAELPVPQVLTREDKWTVQNTSSKDDFNKLDSFRRKEEIELTHSKTAEKCMVEICNLEEDTAELSAAGQLPASQLPKSQNEVGNQYLQAENSGKTLIKTSTVSDHIQWFNKLSVNDPSSSSKSKAPLKFQRTPVRQSVRRINSLLEANRRSVSSPLLKASGVGSPLVKSLSYDSALSSCTEKPSNFVALPLGSESTYMQVSIFHKQPDLASKSCCPPLNPSGKSGVSVRTAGIHKQRETLHPSKSVLEDLTNHETVKPGLKVNANINIPGAAPGKSTITRSASGKERVCYRGSPKNPISKVKLLPAAKPVDL
ncbi:PREDICTED: rho GTPase-activating protein 11A [Merops nubicus]|uniref:rho GTPase-activating protein 11A n=1 Tax=Merops nubicus TaxID=57421 RepID=UPI0004F05DE3|nr:PREDICTED: rho GTPase-activating protein 11A [Merops nubicus]